MPEPGMRQYLIDELNKSIDENDRLNRIITALGSALLDQHELRAIVAEYHRLFAAGFALMTEDERQTWRHEIDVLQERAHVALKGEERGHH